MNYKHCCVVDADGAYKTFVLVLLEQGEDEKGKFYKVYYEEEE